MSKVYSNRKQLQHLGKLLAGYTRLPVSHDVIPGAFLESTLAHVRDARVLNTYDYVDVVSDEDKVGWSIKSTKAATPITWKRAKIADKQNLIAASHSSKAGAQALGDTILRFRNDHAIKSMEKKGLKEIGYARLILFPSGEVRYFEKLLCTRDQPHIFNIGDFEWRWSTQKKTTGKEQLRALHGFHKPTDQRWWAWHGLGENQLHFSGERAWWPEDGSSHTTAFQFPSADKKLSFEQLLELLEAI